MWAKVKRSPLILAGAEKPARDTISWLDTWLAIRDALVPYPDAAQAVGVVLDQLIAEVHAYGDPGNVTTLRPPSVPGPRTEPRP